MLFLNKVNAIGEQHNERIILKTGLKMYTFGDKTYLVITIPYGLTEDEERCWHKTNSGSNIHFIDLQLQRVEFTVYSADLLLDVETENRRPKSVTFLQQTSVKKMYWLSPVSDI